MSQENVNFVLRLLKLRPKEEPCCVCGETIDLKTALSSVYGKTHKRCFIRRDIATPDYRSALWQDFDLFHLAKMQLEDYNKYEATLWKLADELAVKHAQTLTPVPPRKPVRRKKTANLSATKYATHYFPRQSA